MTNIKILLNGEEKIILKSQTIADLIRDLDIDTRKIAVEKDLEIINPDDFAKILLTDGSKIEVVHFIGGG